MLRLTHVACPCVEEEDGSLGDDDALVGNVSNGGARESQAEDGKVTDDEHVSPVVCSLDIEANSPKTLPDQGSNISTLLIIIRRTHGLILPIKVLNSLGRLILHIRPSRK